MLCLVLKIFPKIHIVSLLPFKSQCKRHIPSVVSKDKHFKWVLSEEKCLRWIG